MTPDNRTDTDPETALQPLTPSQENYLEWIYRTAAAGGVVRVRDLAEKLGVRLPSVSRATTQLAKRGLVRHESYGLIELTESGRVAGAAIVRRDECLTRLLVEVLGMSEQAADPSALLAANGWGPSTVVCVMLFSLLHYPCTTTTLTIWAETRSVRWTAAANLLPLATAVAACALVSWLWTLL